MHYTLYRITHKTSGKIYVGVHQTADLDDGYYGSGILIQIAIEKYGFESFEKEILHIFDSPEEMFSKEAEMVDEDFVARDDTYNLKVGGEGGWDYVNYCGLNNSADNNIKGGSALAVRMRSDKELRDSYVSSGKTHGMRMKLENKGFFSDDFNPRNFLGKKHSDEAKKRIGEANSRHQSGKGNSQYGKCWVYSLEQKQSIRIPKESLQNYLDDGWVKGRKIKF